jgi:hypothetical protein
MVSIGRKGTIILSNFDTGKTIARNNLETPILCATLDRPTYLLAVGTASLIIVFDIRSLGVVRRFSPTGEVR